MYCGTVGATHSHRRPTFGGDLNRRLSSRVRRPADLIRHTGSPTTWVVDSKSIHATAEALHRSPEGCVLWADQTPSRSRGGSKAFVTHLVQMDHPIAWASCAVKGGGDRQRGQDNTLYEHALLLGAMPARSRSPTQSAVKPALTAAVNLTGWASNGSCSRFTGQDVVTAQPPRGRLDMISRDVI